MKYLTTLLFILSTFYTGFAQSDEAIRKIEAARIALITERLDLTPAQAREFWPIYNEFTSKRKDIRDTYATQRRGINPEQLSENERKEWLQKGIDLKQKELDLEKEYSEKMLNVISTQQMMLLRNAEADFKKMLLNRINQNRQQQRNMQNNQRMQQRRNN